MTMHAMAYQAPRQLNCKRDRKKRDNSDCNRRNAGMNKDT